MYEFEWANAAVWAAETQLPPIESELRREQVAETLLVHWEEHCIECAPPQCYAVCPLYVARGDHRCARFVYGVYPNPTFRGLLDRAADVRFRRWGKIETRLYGKGLSAKRHRLLDRIDARATGLVNSVSRGFTLVTRRRRLNAKWAHTRERLLSRFASEPSSYDDFVLECYAPDEEPFRLILERDEDGVSTLRHAFDIRPGHNFHKIPAAAFGSLERGRLRLYPEDDAERRVIFTWLDFVRYTQRKERPAANVKVLAWDLDNTLWDGTLLEDGPEGCRLREGARELVEALDARGILQTVVSKNDHEPAWRLVDEFGLQEYFLYPAINWGQKSESLRQIANHLNLGVDSFAFVDDSPFERAEVQSALPAVRAYAPEQLTSLLELPEFDVPVTDASAKRRLSYLTEMERHGAREQFRGDYLEFLRSCRLRTRVFVPREESHVRRCIELVQRSNQLNLSARRYSDEEFRVLLQTSHVSSIALECEDRFGQYGIVGFASIDERGSTAVVRDFVLSCRVAGKHVEKTFFAWLAEWEQVRGFATLRAELTRTERNGPLVKALEGLPFHSVQREDGKELLELKVEKDAVDDAVVEIVAEL